MAFSPLFIGSRNVTGETGPLLAMRAVALSVPFSSGQGNVTFIYFDSTTHQWIFQSPFHRVKECNTEPAVAIEAVLARTFSPLFIGSRNVTVNFISRSTGTATFSPLFIGSRNVTEDRCHSSRTEGIFQSPFHRVKECNAQRKPRPLLALVAFSPLFIGSRNVTPTIRLPNTR